MKKVRLLIVVFVLAVTFTACEQNSDLDELLDTTDIENPDFSTEDESELSEDDEHGG